MRVDLNEFRTAYLAEVDEHLTGSNQCLLEIEAAGREGRVPARELRELMRLLHTIKGLSSMVGVDAIVDLAHEMEGVVRSAEQASAALDPNASQLLVEGLRAISARVAALAKNEKVASAPTSLLSRLAAVVTPAKSTPPPSLDGDPELYARLTASEREQLGSGRASGKRGVRIDFGPSPRKADAGISITSVRERIGRLGELVRVLPISIPPSERAPTGLVFALFVVTDASDDDLAKAVGGDVGDVITLVPIAAPEPAVPAAEPSKPEDDDPRRSGYLRVDVARVDDAIEKLSTLIVTRSRLTRAAAKLAAAGADTRELDAILLDTKRQLRDLRSALLSVRMIPLATVLDRLPLVARGLGNTNGKRVRVAIAAGSAELDKTVAEQLFPALVQFVRNAVDHGIEAPLARRAAGKPEEGTISISASTLGNRLVEIRLADDGAGVDVAKIAAHANLSEAPRTPAAILDVLCRPGFSTREEADRTSGRGVGMDIAKRIVERLGGEISLETSEGQGTTFIVRVPLTIAVVDAFTVACAGHRFAVPVPAVAEIVEVDPSTLPSSPTTGGRSEIRLFGRYGGTVALVELASALRLPPDPARAEAKTTNVARHAVVVRRSEHDVVAFAIDKVLGQQEAVVRPLHDPLVSVLGISGSTDLGDGTPTLVLDLIALSASLGVSS